MTFIGSKPGRPVVGLDVDGTIADYHGHFYKFACQYTGFDDGEVLDLDWDRAHMGEFSEALGMDKNTYRDIKLAYRQGGMKRSIPLFPHAKELVASIHEAGAEVWFCTTRPWQRLDNIDPDTRFFFDHNGLDFNGVIYGEDKYADLLEIVGPDRIVCVLDDLPELYAQAYDLGLRPILRRGPHNDWWASRQSQEKYIQVAYDLGEAEVLINGLIREWKDKHMPDPPSTSKPCPIKGCTVPTPHGHGTDKPMWITPPPLPGTEYHHGPEFAEGSYICREYQVPGQGAVRYFEHQDRPMLMQCTAFHDTGTIKMDVEREERGDFGMPTLGTKGAILTLPEGFRPGDQASAYQVFVESRPRQWGKNTEHKINRVCNEFDMAQTLYKEKAKGYGAETKDVADDLGVKGQFADMNRKWGKMRKMLWDESIPMFPDRPSEDIIEILADMMGHCALTIDFIRQAQGTKEEGPA